MLRYDQRREGDLVVGARAPDVELVTLAGGKLRLSERIGERPLVIVFGSFT
jgi:peroxiredoxin